MRFGIRYQLLLPLALLLVGVVGASSWSARVAAARAEQRIAGQVQSVSQTLANANYSLQKNVLDQMKQLSGAELLLVRANKTRVASFMHGEVPLPTDADFEVHATALGPPVTLGEVSYRCQRVLLKEPHYDAGGVVYIFYPESLLNEAIADAQRPSYIGFAFGLLAVVLTFAVGQRLISRIGTIEKRTRTIASGDFSPMPLTTTNDELRDLAASVNEMAQRLAELQATVRTTERLRLSGQLATGLAHQLRNNATGAKLALQVYLGDHPDDPEALHVTLRQLTLMETNLRRFIDLGRPSSSMREPCPLGAITSEVIALYQPRCRHANLKLLWDMPPNDIVIQGDPRFVQDIVINLVSNALDAAGPNGTVRVTLEQHPDTVSITVADNGPGPPPEVAARLFEPFVTGKPEGIGLGLAVARHAAEALGGRIEWERRDHETIFRVVWPSVPSLSPTSRA